jgi:hypothetical protein
MKFFQIFSIFFVLSCFLFGKFYSKNKIKELKENMAFTVGDITKCGLKYKSQSRKIEYIFKINNTVIKDDISTYNNNCDCLKSNKYVVIYDSLNTENSVLLLNVNDFLEYGLIPPKKVKCIYDNELFYKFDTVGKKLIFINYDSLLNSVGTNPAGTIIW